MNSRISGVIIAVSAAVAGSLVPSTVEAYLNNKFIIALGLGAIVALNTAIALLHILDRGRPSPAQEAEIRASGRRAEPQESTSRPVLAASNTAVHTPSEAGSSPLNRGTNPTPSRPPSPNRRE